MNRPQFSFKETIKKVSRPMYLTALTVLLAVILIARLFVLQIVRGDSYSQESQTRTTRVITIPGKRGRILDRNGNVIADTRNVENVAIIDVTGNSRAENDRLNEIIQNTIRLIKDHGESLCLDFGVDFDGQGYVFNVDGSKKTRFLADVYGYADPASLSDKERDSTASDVVAALAERYGIDTSDTSPEGKMLQLETVQIRYALSLTSFAKYNETIIAKDVGDDLVQAVLGRDDLGGVSISGSYERVYNDSIYLSSVTGYTSRITQEELDERGDTYSADDYTGTAGIEASMEDVLHGAAGSREISIDNMGREQGEISYQRAGEGSDVTLTIDMELQRAVYQILERSLSLILLDKITDSVSTFDVTDDMSSDDIRIPANDVYGALLAYTIDRDHLGSEGASESEQSLKYAYDAYLRRTKDAIKADLRAEGEDEIAYADQTQEYQTYYSYIIQSLFDRGILIRDKIDSDDDIYSAWTGDGSVSAGALLRRAVRDGWADMDAVRDGAGNPESDDFEALIDYILREPCEDYSFGSRMCRYLVRGGEATGILVCQVLFDQGIYSPSSEQARRIASGNESAAYAYIREMIATGGITPAQLYLYPYSASAVVTDVETGEVLALVSYPGYDAGRLSESDYMDEIIMDPTKPMLNTATRQRTAPGSTFKMVTASAGIGEGVITPEEYLYCGGIFDKIDPSPKCWIYPSGHGNLNLAGGIANSCNLYFYQVGYRLGLDDPDAEDPDYDSELGIERLTGYAVNYGLSERSGVEIEESDPVIATRDSVRAAIGQSNNSYTTTQLARYVTDVANSGLDRPLTLIAKESRESDEGRKGQVRTELDEETWDAIHDGMRRVVKGREYFSTLHVKGEDDEVTYIESAGKTGTAQQGGGRPNHALFVGYAPFDEPEIAIAVRIPNGYNSSYASRTAGEIMQYYFDRQTLYDILADDRQAGYGGGD